jgi:hypothetical protein
MWRAEDSAGIGTTRRVQCIPQRIARRKQESQVHNEDAYYGHLVLRLMGCLVLFYTSRVICKGRLTMEEIIFSLKHYWRFVDCEPLELKALSQGMGEKAA